jgi:hypothetical protein
MVATLLRAVPRPAATGFTRLDVQRLIDDHLVLPRHVRAEWQKIIQGAINEQRVEELHAGREEYRGLCRNGSTNLNGSSASAAG